MKKPNFLIILNDDMGYSDIQCYGGEVDTRNLDRLAENGLRFTQFYNSPRCAPTRASLLTGLHPHQCGIGILTENLGPEGYEGNLNNKNITIAELLKENGYATYGVGKWHLSQNISEETNAWPTNRGFESFYGILPGATTYYYPVMVIKDTEEISESDEKGEYYITDAISNMAVDNINQHCKGNKDKPFFQYVAFNAPHWPLHAPEEDVEKYKGRFDGGWDQLRKQRLERMIDMGIIDESWVLTHRDSDVVPWEEANNKEWEARRMEVYAAQINRMDKGIGRIIDALQYNGQLDNTIIMFLSDNGACEEKLEESDRDFFANLKMLRDETRDGKPVQFGNNPNVMPGADETYQSYGTAWANVSNTPFRLYKHWTHEGGISTPFIIHWPEGIEEKGKLRHTPAQLTDIMATIVDITGVNYPAVYQKRKIPPMEGKSFFEVLKKDTKIRKGMFWEHEGNGAYRDNNFKLVKRFPDNWELYDMSKDRTEMNDISGQYPKMVEKMKKKWEEKADYVGVIPREKILELMRQDSSHS